ncbi:hypothetical protein IJ750_02990 [bacterium]|nr:hypothetical protein [bacterium]
MQIQPINNFNNSFKGLWGKDDIIGADKLRHYYPFSNETPEQIEEIRKKYTFSRPDANLEGMVLNYSDTMTVVEKKLPFTESDWIDFNVRQAEMAKTKIRLIKKTLKSFGLKHYLEKIKTAKKVIK